MRIIIAQSDAHYLLYCSNHFTETHAHIIRHMRNHKKIEYDHKNNNENHKKHDKSHRTNYVNHLRTYEHNIKHIYRNRKHIWYNKCIIIKT